MDNNQFYGKMKRKHYFLKKMIIVFLIMVLAAFSGAMGAYYLLSQTKGTSVATTTVSGASAISSKQSVSVASKITKSVVAIRTEAMTTNNYWYGSQVSSGAGSGVIMSSDGYIITCAHVVNGASSIKVTTSDKKIYSAKLVASYTKGDIAVLKIEATNLKPAVFADSNNLSQGEKTYAVGNPEGTFSGSITSGIVSALNRTIKVSINGSSSENSRFPYLGDNSSQIAVLKVIQTDAAVSPGNSGGGLFNANGDLIGIVNAKSSNANSEGLGFAIYGNNALKIAKSLIKTGTYSE